MTRRLPDLGIAPLTARSVALSVLLGTHPPELPVRSLVAAGQLFGIAEGTMRTALSRMLANGEVVGDEGTYALGPRMRDRQAAQDSGRHAPNASWDGTWWLAIVDADRRSVAARRAFRTRMRDHRMGELRPDLWLRPTNLDPPPEDEQTMLVRGTLGERDPRALARRLWPLDEIARSARDLTALASDAAEWLESGDPAVLPDTFLVSVAVVRFLLAEPLLPSEIIGDDWPADHLRAVYDVVETRHTAAMSRFLGATARYNS